MKTLVYLLAFLASPALAQDSEEVDVDEIEYCLNEAGQKGPADQHACIGFIGDACEKELGSGSAADCRMREAAAWEAIVTQRADLLQGKSNWSLASSIREAQEAWSRYRDAHCNATGEFFYQYSGSASAQWQAACLRDTAAERAILLDDWLMRSADFE